MSVPPPLRSWGCSGVVIFGDCVPQADVIVLPTNGGGASWSRMDASWLPDSPGSAFVAESPLPAVASLGIVIGPSGPVSALHSSPHVEETHYGPGGVPTKYPVYPGSADMTPSRYGPGGMLGKRLDELRLPAAGRLERRVKGLE